MNNDSICFNYAVTDALNHYITGKHPKGHKRLGP